MIKKTVVILVILFIVIQFIRPARNDGNAAGPDDITNVVTVPDTVMSILKKSCYDCHSNHTNYPWYMNINPGGWLMASHIKDGKEELNFSEYATYSKKKRDRKLTITAEQVSKHEMPISSYLLIHSGAKLSDGQIKIIKDWVDSAKQELKTK